MFSEALSVFHEVFPAITSKKRSRAEGFSNDRSNVMLSDRPVLGPSIGKVGVQGHPVTGGFELEQQKSDERTKNVVPNKRTRTSMVDVTKPTKNYLAFTMFAPKASFTRFMSSGTGDGSSLPFEELDGDSSGEIPRAALTCRLKSI